MSAIAHKNENIPIEFYFVELHSRKILLFQFK